MSKSTDQLKEKLETSDTLSRDETIADKRRKISRIDIDINTKRWNIPEKTYATGESHRYTDKLQLTTITKKAELMSNVQKI